MPRKWCLLRTCLELASVTHRKFMISHTNNITSRGKDRKVASLNTACAMTVFVWWLICASYAPATLSRLGSPTRHDLIFLPKSGRSGIKCPRLSFTTAQSRPSSDIATIHPDLAPTRPDLATTWPNLSRFSYDLPRFIQTYADWALTGADLTPT
jgi:hypothetical protein